MRRVLRGGGPIAAEYPLVFDPAFDGELIVAEEDGSPRAACALVVRELVLPDVRLQVGLIGSVVTAPAWRGRGLASRVLAHAEARGLERGCLATLLWADDPGFYRRRGYAEVGTERDFLLEPCASRGLPPPSGVRAARPGDAAAIHALYAAHLARVERDRAETRALLACPGMRVLVREGKSGAAAYACMGRGADLQGVVHEWAGAADDVAALARAHLEQHGRPIVVMAPPGASALEGALRSAGALASEGVLGMGKLLDLGRALELLELFAKGALASRVRGERAELSGEAGSLELDASALLAVLFAPRRDRSAVEELEAGVGVRAPRLPLAPFAWGLDSI